MPLRVPASSPTSSRATGIGSRADASPLRSIVRAPAESRRSGRSAPAPRSVASSAPTAAAAIAPIATKRRVVASVASISVSVPATTTAPPAAGPRPSSPSGAA